jgi:beta-lactamase class D
MTQKLGMEKFQHYVDLFNYGNKDLSGEDALTTAWLNTTLAISPDEQIDFLKNVLTRQYKISKHSYDMLANILPTFPLDNGWTIHGKTGSASNEDHLQFGWFIGWAQKADHQIVFVRYAVDRNIIDTPAGPRNRDDLLKQLPVLLPQN